MSVVKKWHNCLRALHIAAEEAWETEMVQTLMADLELEESDLTMDELKKQWTENRIEEWEIRGLSK
jgi:hypothetical protein